MAGLLTVLVVEDDPDIRVIIDIALGIAGAIDARFAATGGEAIELLSRPDRIDCVLLDPGLPDMDGLALMPRFAALDPPPPVIVVSASVMAAAMARYLAAGARKVIAKPFDPLMLASEVITTVGGAR